MQKEIVERIKKKGATPCYVFDIERLRQRAAALKEYLGEKMSFSLCYAVKANPFLVKELDGYADKFEVCSPGELYICKQYGIDMGKIVLSGVNKQEEDIFNALRWGVITYTAESVNQLLLLQKSAHEIGKTIEVLLRLTSGNQFGMDQEQICSIVGRRDEFPNIKVKGIQYYSGTQKKAQKIKAEVDGLCDICDYVESLYGYRFEVVEFGPGMRVKYFEGRKESPEKNELEVCRKALTGISYKWDLVLEIGRFLVYDCGMYFTQVVDIKENKGKKYCIADGGINHVTYYGQMVGTELPEMQVYRCREGVMEEIEIDQEIEDGWCLCGSLCTSSDILVRNLPVEDIQMGDMIVFKNIGAYSVTEGIYLFLSRRMPQIYLSQGTEMKLIRDADETYLLNCRDIRLKEPEQHK